MEFIKIAEFNVEVLNHALRDVPSDKVRVHACWGNYEAHTFWILPWTRCSER